jgi:hypothetical protein
MTSAIRLHVLAAVASTGLSLSAPAQAQQATMSFFVTSVGKGNGADLGGLAGRMHTVKRSPKPRARPKQTGVPI